MQVQTVLGAVSPADLGPTLAHEHLLVDLQCWFMPPQEASRQFIVDTKVTASLRGLLASDPYHCRDNLVMRDERLAASELMHFRVLGGRTVVDLSTRTIGPFPTQLVEIARRSEVNIVAGTGFYIAKAHPAWVAEASVEQLTDFMLREIRLGMNDTDVRAGIIGELGVSAPIVQAEECVLRAAARAQRETGLAINVHLPIFARQGHLALDILADAGADLTRVVLSHLDESLDFDYVRALARRGPYVELDTFGSDFAFDESGTHEPSDWERIELLARLLDAGLAGQVLLSQDVCTKMHLVYYGGYGYGHISRTIVPRLRRRGIDETTIELLMVKNPARMLSGEAV